MMNHRAVGAEGWPSLVVGAPMTAIINSPKMESPRCRDGALRLFRAVRPHVRIRDGGSSRIMWERGLRWIGRRRAFHIGDEPWDRIARSMLV
jgi:hypothetical protein